MYKAFDLKITKQSFDTMFPGCSSLKFVPSNVFQKASLDEAIKSLWSLNANEIRKTWFSECQIDVFLSHSSSDKELARTFGAYIQKVFGLNVFIDSEAWHHMDIMLKELDRRFCVSEENPDGTIKTYSYNDRNVMTAHVHMILSHALTKMIDNAECFIYLNTPNSTTRKEGDSIETLSPWLFHELAMVEIIEEKPPTPVMENFTCDSADNRSYGPTLKYSVDTKRLKELSLGQVKQWQDCFSDLSSARQLSALNLLYKIIEE